MVKVMGQPVENVFFGDSAWVFCVICDIKFHLCMCRILRMHAQISHTNMSKIARYAHKHRVRVRTTASRPQEVHQSFRAFC